MFQASYIAHPLLFVRPAGTSRGYLEKKPCFFIRLSTEDGKSGLGEVSFVPGLSVEKEDELEIRVDHICKLISRGEMKPGQHLPALPGVQFALECALQDLENEGKQLLFPSEFTQGLKGIPTNGLIWMGTREFMISQIREKIQLGFRVLKLKVGSLDFDDELEVLRWIRSEFGKADLEIRLDANGAWSASEALEKMKLLGRLRIHSIEQPIAPGRHEEMAELCSRGGIPVALDEELIAVWNRQERIKLLDQIRPAYIILKPGLLGGFTETTHWIDLARFRRIGWWITSALESNVGLNAIAQWTWNQGVERPQGLGTGALYTNNIHSPLDMRGEELWYRPDFSWDLKKAGL